MNYRKKFFLITCAFILLWAGITRVYKLDEQSWWMDEGYSVNAALSTIEKGYPLLPSGLAYNQHIVYTYFLAGSIKIFGLSAWSTRAPSVLASMLTLPIIFFFTKKMIGPRVAYLATLLASFSYWEIAWARQARFYALFQLTFWAALFFFWNAVTSRKKIDFLWAGFFSCLTFFLHPLGIFLIPIYVATIIVTLLNMQGVSLRMWWRKNWPSIATISLLLAVTGIFFYRPIYETFREVSVHRLFYLPKYLSFFRNGTPGVALLAVLSLLFPFAHDKRQSPSLNPVLYLWTIFLIPFTGLSFFVFLLQYRYVFIILPALFILSAFSLISIYDWLANRHHPVYRLVYIGVVLVYFLVSPEFQVTPTPQYALESDRPNTKGFISYTPQPNWQGAYDYILKNKRQDDILISAQPVFTYIYTCEPGQWIFYTLTKKPERGRPPKPDERDPYVGAKTIVTKENLMQTILNKHGFVVLDSFARDGRIPTDILTYIEKKLVLRYTNTFNRWSTIWVYEF